MAPGARSRGCEGCQRRKIKCDGKTPVCGKCERLGITCSGAREGPIILAYNPGEKLQKKQRNALIAAPKGAVGSDGSYASRSLTPYGPQSIGGISDSLVIQEWFTFKLQEVVSIPHQQYNSLVVEMPKLAVSSEYPTLKRAVLATSAAFGGVATGNRDLLKTAQEMYAGTLRILMRRLSRPPDEEDTRQLASSSNNQVTVEMVGTAALLVWYEAMVGTNPNGWIAHAFGAGKILLLKDPQDYRLGLSHSIFRASRYMMANASILIVQPTILGASPWLTDPFSFNPKKSFDKVVDFLLVIPTYLAWVNEKRIAGSPIPRSSGATRIMEEVRQLEQGLSSSLLVYEQELIVAGRPGLFHDISPDRIDSKGVYHPRVRDYFSDHIVECVTHYDLCRLMIALIKAACSDADEFMICREEAHNHSASVLAGVAFSEANTTTEVVREKFGLLCLLITLLLASPTKEHRDYATSKVEGWGSGGGLRGASHYQPIIRWKNLTTIWLEQGLTPGESNSLQIVEEASDPEMVNSLEISLREREKYT